MSFTQTRTVLISGASRGIGRVVAERLAAQGARCLLLARDASALDEVVENIRAAGGSADAIVCDLASQYDPDELAGLLSNKSDTIDAVLMNAAAGGIRVPLPDYPSDLWRQLFQINVHAVHTMLAATHRFLIRSEAGRLVFVSTGVARKWKASTGAYAASKAALEAIAGIYAEETVSTTIRSNIVSPGATRTGMRAQAYPDENPGQLKTPEDIAPLFVELLSSSCTAHGTTVNADQWLAQRRTR